MRLGIAGFVGQLVKCADIVDAAEHGFDRLDGGLEGFDLGDNGLGGVLVVPEAVLAHLVFKFFSAGEFCGQVKESPGWRSSGLKGFRSIGRGFRESWDGS